MQLKNYVPVVLGLLLVMASCQPDDGTFQPVPERDRAEQQVVDNDSLIGYFETHYYNASTFDGSTDFTMEDIVITELEDGETLPDGHTLLIDAVETHTTTFVDVDYTYYILRINQGSTVNEGPKFTDDVRVRYSGNLMDEEVFDSAVTPVDFDMINLIPAWSRVMPQFNPAESFSIIDGQVTYTDYGLGVMFVPSGLAYFSSPPLGVPVYSNLIFKFELLQTEENDHDADGIPTYLEDLNDNTNIADDDTDNDSLPNYVDVDDDGDGILTRNELSRTEYTINVGDDDPVFGTNEFELSRVDNGDNTITITTGTYIDTDGNGIDDHLDDGVEIDYSQE